MKTQIDIHQTITDNIVAAIEAGAGNPTMPWHRSGMASLLPKNPSTGNCYQGINVVSLWVSAELRGFQPFPMGVLQAMAVLGRPCTRRRKMLAHHLLQTVRR